MNLTKHVVFLPAAFSDAGSTPAASTTLIFSFSILCKHPKFITIYVSPSWPMALAGDIAVAFIDGRKSFAFGLRNIPHIHRKDIN